MKSRIAVWILALALLTRPLSAAAASEHVVLAGGCFWGMQAVFESLKGVSHVTAGFAGGAAITAHYDLVSTGTTGHAESVDVAYDPSQISFTHLLDVYFLVAHDPTELNFQGPDEGTQYRSEIFYSTDAQRQQAQAYISQLGAERRFNAPIVTKLASLGAFYPAEAYHQHYYDHNPDNPYIVYNDKPKVEQLSAQFPGLVRVSP